MDCTGWPPAVRSLRSRFQTSSGRARQKPPIVSAEPRRLCLRNFAPAAFLPSPRATYRPHASRTSGRTGLRRCLREDSQRTRAYSLSSLQACGHFPTPPKVQTRLRCGFAESNPARQRRSKAHRDSGLRSNSIGCSPTKNHCRLLYLQLSCPRRHPVHLAATD